MDEHEEQEHQTTTVAASSQFNKCHKFLKKTLQFLLPALSLVSFLSSVSSPISHFFHHCFNCQFSASFWPLLGKIFERKFMFFICNGILAFLAKSLIFPSSSPPAVLLSDVSTDHDEFTKIDAERTEPDSSSSVMEADELEDEEAITQRTVTGCLEGYVTDCREEEEPEFKTKKEKASLNMQVLETNSRALMIGSEDDDEEQEESESLIPPISVEEEGNEVNVSTEELNRKFDEFIRKMREEIRIEAQRQVIAV